MSRDISSIPEITIEKISPTSGTFINFETKREGCTRAELKKSSIDEDMDFETIKEVWNLYELEN